MNAPHILVVGAGSVGKRHAVNFGALGCAISAVDPREDRRKEVASRVDLVSSYGTVGEALARQHIDAVVIASPPSAHVEQTSQALAAGLPALLEKPVAPDLSSGLTLAECAAACKRPVLLGYTFRWWDPVRRLKALIDESRVGRVLRVQMTMAAHLADWHPWEPYQGFFMAHASLGGGALLDESHFLDLLVWLFAWPMSLSASIEHLSALEIDTDDNVEISVSMPGGARALIHLDLFARPHERSIQVFGDQGTLEWNNESNHVRYAVDPDHTWIVDRFTCERNEMFVAEARHFLDVLRGGATPLCTLDDGVRVLQLVEAVRESHRRRAAVSVPEPYGR